MGGVPENPCETMWSKGGRPQMDRQRSCQQCWGTSLVPQRCVGGRGGVNDLGEGLELET